MYVQMQTGALTGEIQRVCDVATALGLKTRAIRRDDVVAIALLGAVDATAMKQIETLDGVDGVFEVDEPYRLAGRTIRQGSSIVKVRDVVIGGDEPVVIAGPCTVENPISLTNTATRLAELGADLLRGGAFKPRTSPYSFQGLGRDALKMLADARRQSGLGIVTEAVSVEVFDDVEQTADIVQIGARNMQNFALLERAGRSTKPILLKRHMSATLEELLLAAEYILATGNPNVILCERGIRTFGDHSRFTLDINIIPVLKQETHLPVIVDPSHAAGRRDIVIPLAKAALAAGADGLIIEVHPEPDMALCDGAQSLTIEQFESLMVDIKFVTSDKLFAGVAD